MCSDHDHDFLYPVVGEGVLRRKRERLSSGVLKIGHAVWAFWRFMRGDGVAKAAVWRRCNG